MEDTREEDEHKFVTFKLDAETYALPISTVREVLEFTSATQVPQTPPFVRGVINLRGNVLPVVDLRLKFGMGRTEGTLETRVIVVEATVDGEPTPLGALADSVEDVIDLPPAEIGPPPKIGTRLRTEFIRGIGRKDADFIILLDIEQIFTLDELTQVGGIERTAIRQESATEADPSAAEATPPGGDDQEVARVAAVPPAPPQAPPAVREDG